MYQKNINRNSTLKRNESVEGESLENKLKRMVNNGEQVSDSKPMIYTERKEGVLPSTDIRADHWSIALNAMDKVRKSEIAKKDDLTKEIESTKESTEESGA